MLGQRDRRWPTINTAFSTSRVCWKSYAVDCDNNGFLILLSSYHFRILVASWGPAAEIKNGEKNPSGESNDSLILENIIGKSEKCVFK